MEGLNALRASSRRPYCQACNVAFLGTAHHAICPQAAMNELESGRKPSAHASSIMLRLAYRLHQGCMQHAQVREYNPMPKLTKLNESNMHTLPAHPPQQPISEFSGRDRDPDPAAKKPTADPDAQPLRGGLPERGLVPIIRGCMYHTE